MGKLIDKKKLLAHLDERASTRNPGLAGLLVQHAIYEGLATAIRRGDFDYEVREDADLDMEQADA